MGEGRKGSEVTLKGWIWVLEGWAFCGEGEDKRGAKILGTHEHSDWLWQFWGVCERHPSRAISWTVGQASLERRGWDTKLESLVTQWGRRQRKTQRAQTGVLS